MHATCATKSHATWPTTGAHVLAVWYELSFVKLEDKQGLYHVVGGGLHGVWVRHMLLPSLGLLQPVFGGAVKDSRKSPLTVASSSECPCDAEWLDSDW